MLYPNIAKVLKKERERAKVTQSALAKELGVTSQFVCNVERGAAPFPPTMVIRVANFFLCDVNTFIKASVKDFEERYRRQVK